MPWIKLDDNWMDHPKIIRAGRDARDMWLASITWCAKHLTDGFFPESLLPHLAVMAGVDIANVKQFACTLVDTCLWDACENGYKVHDYLDYNPTKEQALSTKEARKEAGSRGGQARVANAQANAQAKSKQSSTPYPSPIPLNINKGNDSSKKEEEEPPAPFDIFQRVMETHGILVNTASAIQAVIDIVNMGATSEDLIKGIDWKKDNIDPPGAVIFASSLIGPTRTAMLQRTQPKPNGSNGAARKSQPDFKSAGEEAKRILANERQQARPNN